ncbi:MAG: hypothetical protein V2A76_16860, partial [Planctomycetota bacterium]
QAALEALRANPPQKESTMDFLVKAKDIFKPDQVSAPAPSKAEQILLSLGEKALTGGMNNNNAQQSPKEYLRDVTETAGLLGFQRPSTGPAEADDTDKVVRIIESVKTGLMEAGPSIIGAFTGGDNITPQDMAEAQAMMNQGAPPAAPAPPEPPQQFQNPTQPIPQEEPIVTRIIPIAEGLRDMNPDEQRAECLERVEEAKQAYTRLFGFFMQYETMLLAPGADIVVKASKDLILGGMRKMKPENLAMLDKIIMATPDGNINKTISTLIDNYRESIRRFAPTEVKLMAALNRVDRVFKSAGGQAALKIVYAYRKASVVMPPAAVEAHQQTKPNDPLPW